MSQLLDLKSKAKTRNAEKGFTLIELVLVVVILAVITTVAASRFSSLTGWKQESELRYFSSLWRQLFNEAYGRGETYRLVVNLDENYYQVFREIPLPPGKSVNVDLLSNLRTKREKERRAKEDAENIISVEEGFKKEDERTAESLDIQYYSVRFRDLNTAVELGHPLEFSNLVEKKYFTDGLRIRDIERGEEKIEEGQVIFRFTPQGSSDAATIFFSLNEQVFKAKSEPTSGNLKITEEVDA